MPSFNPFTSVSGKSACTLFEIRLENDFIVFRGDDHEASGQLLKGTVVLCLSAPLKIDNVHLKLTGTVHYGWTDAKMTATGISTHKVDKTMQFYDHRWRPFVGTGSADHSPDGSAHHSKGLTLPPGNYEWPFQLMLDGNTTESIEGMREASIIYRLKATVARGKLSHDLHAYKRLRIIRTLDPSALEFIHAMSVENIWPNKIEYSIVVPQKAVVFGSYIPLEMRFTPLLKGLELGDIRITLVETHDIILHSQSGPTVKEHKKEREIDAWTISVTRDEYWKDMIEDTGQEGWVVNKSLNLPKKLSRCLQDVNAKGIRVRHKLKLVVALMNPDGHISELRATLPVSIFISPNMPLDEEGNLVRQLPNAPSPTDAVPAAPPSYSEHVLDQLYEDIDPSDLRTPIGGRSGVSSPLHAHSRVGSSENLAAMFHSTAVSPAVLSSRLQSMSLEQRNRNSSWNSGLSAAAGSRPASPPHTGDGSQHSPPMSVPLTRHNSGNQSPGVDTPEHVDFPEISELCKVPSYQTAVKTPVRPLDYSDGLSLPDYQTAMSAPASPRLTADVSQADPLDTIAEGLQEDPEIPRDASSHGNASRQPPATLHRRQASFPFAFPHVFHMQGEGDERRRLHLLQTRERVA
ncbi:hypothetical protein VTK56DRAFT_1028 [Thermocarpiscus australiensis]